MPSEVRHLVDRGQSFPLVRLTGVLDAESAGPVRSTLLDVLAGQPEAVVVDVGGLRVPRHETLSVLREVRDATRDWPATRLALCCAEDGNGTAWESTGWPIWPDRDGAFASLGRPDAGRRVSLDLEPVVGAARRARELITETCLRWELSEVAGDACIVATEMVNNVVAHARTPMSVLLARHGETVSVAVRDGSPVLPRFTGPVAPTAYGGRGLLLIDAVAARWGRLALSGGKVVWAHLNP
ncbi:anti-anti-sigma factor [Actinoplanes oblitus]|uniref:Anti-anti-sigma factor n=1 Tax=Actinoplanes oblitus TaxID=3040509 RepID=A0ABY8WH76_9ACTN|nr:ATP-binding protein [Actinoplanes oblitus]WIM95714.1 anti-anti-sigma factor [Actinoplanes oblitus]